MEVIPFGSSYNTQLESDISEYSFGWGGLRFILDTAPHNVNVRQVVEITFPKYAGVRILDEGDVFCSWSSELFLSSHHIFEIIRNGWIDQELNGSGLLAMSGAAVRHREWFICTSNKCANVLSQSEPLVRVLE